MLDLLRFFREVVWILWPLEAGLLLRIPFQAKDALLQKLATSPIKALLLEFWLCSPIIVMVFATWIWWKQRQEIRQLRRQLPDDDGMIVGSLGERQAANFGIYYFSCSNILETADSIILRGIQGADVMIERYNSPKMNSPQTENASSNAELMLKGGVGLIGVVPRSTDESNAGTVNDGQDEVVITDTVASVSRIIDNVTLPNDHENNDMDTIQSQHYQDDLAHRPGPIVDAAATSQGHSKPDSDARAPRNERRKQWMAQKKAKKGQRKQENNAKKERNKREGEVEDGLDQNGKKRQHHRHFNPDFNDSRRSSRGPASIPLQQPILNMYFKGGMIAYSSEVGHIPQMSSTGALPLQNVAHHYLLNLVYCRNLFFQAFHTDPLCLWL